MNALDYTMNWWFMLSDSLSISQWSNFIRHLVHTLSIYSSHSQNWPRCQVHLQKYPPPWSEFWGISSSGILATRACLICCVPTHWMSKRILYSRKPFDSTCIYAESGVWILYTYLPFRWGMIWNQWCTRIEWACWSLLLCIIVCAVARNWKCMNSLLSSYLDNGLITLTSIFERW